MTTPSTTPTRKLIDVEKIIAVLDAEKHLIGSSLLLPVGPVSGLFTGLIYNEELPQPGPLAVANCEHVGRCAMGSLLYASGKVSYRELNGMDGDAREWQLKSVKVLYDTYGLQRYHAKEIIEANDLDDADDEEGINARRRRVKERVRSLFDAQRDDPADDLECCRDLEATMAVNAGTTVREHFDALDLGYVDYYGPDPDFS